MIWIFTATIVTGMALLIAALEPIRSIGSALGKGPTRSRWRRLYLLIICFILSYALFAVIASQAPTTYPDLVVGFILMGGGGFVLAVAQLSASTTSDLVRIPVLERDLMRDPLTGVFNRRYLDGRLEEEILRARRSGLPLSALMIDLDHFKDVNDQYGHLVGDQVLRHVSSLILSQVRINDMVVRYGGEEFVVIAPDSSLEEVTRLGERLLDRLRNHNVMLPGNDVLKVTASIGASELGASDNRSAFLRRADYALYEAKRGGRDRLGIADGGGVQVSAAVPTPG
jgi:diguanylate cyclase (GGDEF)-like protein